MAKLKKHSKLLVTIVVMLSLSAITAFALSLYYSMTRYNDFTKGQINAQIEENNSEPVEEQSPELTPEESVIDGEKVHITAKKIVIKNNSKNDGYIRARLIPGWKDSDGNIVATLGNISDFGNLSLDESEQYLAGEIIFSNGVSAKLAENWYKNWDYNSDNNLFIYKKIVNAGDETEPLITDVVMSDEAYNLAKENDVDFILDVLADIIQDEGERRAVSDRNFNKN